MTKSKKYKNKLTGDIVVECYNGYSIENRFYDTNIPKNIIETSSDWEEIIELCVPIGTIVINRSDGKKYVLDNIHGQTVILDTGIFHFSIVTASNKLVKQ